jgi:hypothetical protein
MQKMVLPTSEELAAIKVLEIAGFMEQRTQTQTEAVLGC